MEMNIEISCPCCIRGVYRAIGEFLATDQWLSNIIKVEVFVVDDEEGAVGAAIAWDVHPCRDQIAFFRDVWRRETNMPDVVILHDAPSSIVDDPRELPASGRASR